MPPTTKQVAARLERVAARRRSADEAWREAIRAASEAGMTYREIAPLAGVSYQRVAQIVKGHAASS